MSPETIVARQDLLAFAQDWQKQGSNIASYAQLGGKTILDVIGWWCDKENGQLINFTLNRTVPIIYAKSVEEGNNKIAKMLSKLR